jgi:small-conductance mechanosensitive channel
MHPSLLLLAARSGLFAEGRFLGRVLDEWIVDAQEFVRLKLPHLLVITAIAFVLNRLLRAITFHMTRVAEQHTARLDRVGQVKTLAGILRATGLAIIGLIFGLQFLDTLGVNLAPLLASAGVAGIAIGLAAQNIVKDMLNGVLILVEDQFNVGDMVRLAGATGTVEAMTLRKTSIRDGDGTLYVIPNSQITTVANLSIGYSVATVNVSVDFSANPDKVQAILKEVATEVRNSEAFQNVFLADPQILGVDSMKGSQLIFPVVFRTKATQQYAPVREFQRRVRLALEANHMLPGDPNRIFNSFLDSGSASGSASRATASNPAAEHEAPPPHDPTTLKPQESNPFTGT